MALQVRRVVTGHDADGKAIAVIDFSPPAYDRSAGSRFTYDVLKHEAAMGRKVTFLSMNTSDTTRYKQELQALGIKVIEGDRDGMKRIGLDGD